MQHRPGRVSPLVALLSKGEVPEFLSGDVKAVKSRRAKPGIDPLAVGGRGGGAVRIGFVGGLRGHVVGPAAPQFFSVLTGKANHQALVAHGLGDENTLSPDDWRGIPGLRQGHFPFHPGGSAPVQRKFLLGGNSAPICPTPSRPWRSRSGWHQQHGEQ